MQPVSESWKRNQEQFLVGESFVELRLELDDPEASEDAHSTDNGSVYFSNTSQVVSGAKNNIVPYLTLERNLWVLDGSKRAVPASNYGDTGYIGNVMSRRDGSFPTTPIITINFSKVFDNLIPGLVIEWDTAHGDYATQFNVTAYNGATKVAQTSVLDNDSVRSSVYLDMTGYDSIVIEILKWSFPYRRPRVANVTLGHVLTYGKDSFMRFEHSQEVSPLSARLPKMGIKFSVDNTDNQYNPYNKEGYSKYLIERQEITIKYGYKLDDTVEWIKGGTFYLSSWDAPQHGLMANFEARDMLEFMNGIYKKGVYSASGVSLKSLAEDVLVDANLPTRKDKQVPWKIHDSLADIYTSAPLPLVTHAECLQLIANASCCVLYCDRDGFLRIEPLSEELTDYEMNDFNSFRPPEISLTKPLSRVNVTRYTYFVENEITEIYEGDFPVEGEATFYITYSSPAVDATVSEVAGGELVKATYYTNGCEITLRGNGLVGFVITGKPLHTSEVITSLMVNEKGEVQEVNNPLITSQAQAVKVANWVKDNLSSREIVGVDWRADPRLDALDIVSVQNKYGKSPVRTVRAVFTYNGGFRGRGEGIGLNDMA